jgi:hypothetical protein
LKPLNGIGAAETQCRTHGSDMVMREDEAQADDEEGRVSNVSAEFAESAASTWRAIDAALSPIIGQHGVVTLYQRSLYRTGKTVPCLLAARDEAMQPGDFVTLQSLLAALPIAEATAVHDVLLQAFYELLASLIGPSLAERLLRSVSANLRRERGVTQGIPS